MIGVKIAYYKKEDWSQLLLVSDDRESMHDSWNEWHLSYSKAKREFTAKGFQVIDVEVDLDELVRICRSKGLKNTGKTSSQFVQER
jgi:hypothetical protein